jgi:large subunit ribosomal protein L23
MRDPRKIIRRPIITEKSTLLQGRGNQYVFEVDRTANKIEIAHAVKKIFDVTVLQVRTLNVKGKPKRLGAFAGRRPGWKKAIVTLKEGDYIEVFEEV